MVVSVSWPNEDIEVRVSDFCAEAGDDQVYTVTSLTDADDSVRIKPFPVRDGCTAKIVKVSDLIYLPPTEPVEVPLSNYHDELIEAVGSHLIARTVFLAYGKQPIGTGTLVRCQGVYGILTASHVLHAVEPEVGLGEYDGKFLHVCIDDKRSAKFAIPCELLREIVVGEPKPNPKRSDYRWEGPDVTFIRVPEHKWLAKIKDYKLFVDVDEQLRNYAVPPEESTVFSVGFPEALFKPRSDGKGLTVRFMSIALGKLAELTKIEDNGFQYLEFPVQLVQPNVKENIPKTFRGISGGGIWCYRLLKTEDDDGCVRIGFDAALLSGVNYYQSDIHVDPEYGESRTIRCHFYNVLEHLQQRLIADADGGSFDDFKVAT